MKKRSLFFLLVSCNFLIFAQEADSVIELPEVTTYIPSQESDSFFEITSDKIEETTATSIPELLQQEGFLVMNTGGKGAATNVSIAGYAAFCIRVFVDGILANNPLTGEFDWNSIPLADIKSIKIQHYPSDSPEFSGAVVLITTRLHEVKSTEITLSSKSYAGSLGDELFASLRHLNAGKIFGYELNCSLDKADNYFKLKNNESFYGNESNSENLDLRLWRYIGNWLADISVKEMFNQINLKNPLLNSTDFGTERDFWLFPQLMLKNAITGTSVTASYRLSSVIYDYEKRINGTSNFYEDINNAHVWFEEVKQEFKSANLSVAVSATQEAKFETSNSRNQLRLFSAWAPSYKDFNFNVQMNLLFVPEYNLFQPVPSLSANWKWITLSAYRQLILPTFNQLYYAGSGGRGNPDLKPEEGWGTTLELKPVSFISFIYQLTYYQDKIRWENGSFYNTTHGVFNYFEVISAYSWKYFEYNLRLQYTRATLPDGNQIMWVPFWQSNGQFTLKVYPFRYSLLFTYCGERPVSNINATYYPAYLLIGLNFSVEIKKATFKFAIDNLLDERFVYHENYPAPSRSVTASVNVKL